MFGRLIGVLFGAYVFGESGGGYGVFQYMLILGVQKPHSGKVRTETRILTKDEKLASEHDLSGEMMSACRAYTDEEYHKIVASFSGDCGPRDRCLFVVGCLTGFRVSELLSLRLCDVCFPDGTIRKEVTVARKNIKRKRKSRAVCLPEPARAAVREWLMTCRTIGYAKNVDPLFPKLGYRAAVSRFGVYKLLKRGI